LGLQPATFCNFYPSGFLGCGARRNVLTKVESGDVDQKETISLRYESVALTPDEKNGFQPRGFLVTTFREMCLSRIFLIFYEPAKNPRGSEFFLKTNARLFT